MALAVEKSSYSPQGHEVTSPPSDDDQGETIRIVTEAVEQSESGSRRPPVPPAPAREPAVSSACFQLRRHRPRARHGVRRRSTIGPTTYPNPGSEQINPNHREHTQVAAGLGNRSQIREELPLSTRVHELAKELGLKSQELLERIQKWGLDVKANALASLDPPMVDRIRELMDQPAAGTGATTAVRLRHRRPRRRRPRRRPRSAAARRAVSERPRAAEPGRSAPARLRQARPRSSRVRWRRHRRQRRPRRRAAAAAPQRLIPGSSPSGIGATPGVGRPRGARSSAGAPRPRRRSSASGRPPGSAWRLFRNPARRRPAFRPHAASRHGPAAGRPAACRHRAATRARGRSSLPRRSSPAVGTVRLSTARNETTTCRRREPAR